MGGVAAVYQTMLSQPNNKVPIANMPITAD